MYASLNYFRPRFMPMLVINVRVLTPEDTGIEVVIDRNQVINIVAKGLLLDAFQINGTPRQAGFRNDALNNRRLTVTSGADPRPKAVPGVDLLAVTVKDGCLATIMRHRDDKRNSGLFYFLHARIVSKKSGE
jgi:hypothetical protein